MSIVVAWWNSCIYNSSNSPTYERSLELVFPFIGTGQRYALLDKKEEVWFKRLELIILEAS